MSTDFDEVKFVVRVYDLGAGSMDTLGTYQGFAKADASADLALRRIVAKRSFAKSTLTVIPWDIMDNRCNVACLYIDGKPMRAVAIYLEDAKTFEVESMVEIAKRARFVDRCSPGGSALN